MGRQRKSKILSTDKIYVKHNSFETFWSCINAKIEEQRDKAIRVLGDVLRHKNINNDMLRVLESVKNDLLIKSPKKSCYQLTVPVADEVSLLENSEIPKYFYHRYRYDTYPEKKILDLYPPCLQIEPTSICNYRCVFCYQDDKTFSDKKSGHMGSMNLETFKHIVDQIEGNVEFVTLASRGEPFICKDIDAMLEYCSNKFLGLKINTNASLLNEKHCHAILASGVQTLVFSVDAEAEPMYSRLRVHGNLENVIKNIRRFKSIRERHYPKAKIITRISGVKVNKEQKMNTMVPVWKDLVEQVTFVKYNPWKNIYEAPLNHIKKPCSDLWRRMFVWHDGSVNPCDTDYKSYLSLGKIIGKDVTSIWHSDAYTRLRKKHLNGLRGEVTPCQKCFLV